MTATPPIAAWPGLLGVQQGEVLMVVAAAGVRADPMAPAMVSATRAPKHRLRSIATMATILAVNGVVAVLRAIATSRPSQPQRPRQ